MKDLLICFCIVFTQLGAVSQSSNPFELKNVTLSDTSKNDLVIPQISGSDLNANLDSSNSLLLQREDSNSIIYNPFEIRGNRISMKKELLDKGEEPVIVPNNEEISPITYKLRYLIFGIISLLVSALCISSNRYRFNQLVKSVWNSNQLFNLYRDTDAWKNGQSIFLYLLFFLNTSLFLFISQQMKFFGDQISFQWYIGLAGIFGVYLIRHLAMISISWIYPLSPTVGIYNYSIGVNNMIAGVLFLPITMCLVYGPEIFEHFFFYLGLGTIGLFYLIRQLKGFLLAIGMKGFNLIYFFIYLCAIDIAPILLIWRMISGAS